MGLFLQHKSNIGQKPFLVSLVSSGSCMPYSVFDVPNKVHHLYHVKVKVERYSSSEYSISELCGITHAHKWTPPPSVPSKQAGTWFTYPRGMDGWVDLGDWFISMWFTWPQTVTRPRTKPTAHGQALNSQPVDHESDNLTITLPSHQSSCSLLIYIN